MFSLKDVLDLAAKIEKNGETVYRSALKRTDDPELAEMLEWMADEEARHAEKFSSMRDDIASSVPDPMLEQLGRSMMTDVVENRSFSLEDVDFTKIESVTDLIRIMIDFERDTVTFYGVFRDFMTAETDIEQLDQIIADEEEHIRKLEICRNKNLACFRV